MLSCSSGMVAPFQRQGMPRASLPAVRDGSRHVCESAAHGKYSVTLILTGVPALLLQHTRQAVRFLCSEVKANLGRNCVVVREEEQGFESRQFKEGRLQQTPRDSMEAWLLGTHCLRGGVPVITVVKAGGLSSRSQQRLPGQTACQCAAQFNSCALQAILDFSVTSESLLESFASEDSVSESLWDSAHAGQHSCTPPRLGSGDHAGPGGCL